MERLGDFRRAVTSYMHSIRIVRKERVSATSAILIRITYDYDNSVPGIRIRAPPRGGQGSGKKKICIRYTPTRDVKMNFEGATRKRNG